MDDEELKILAIIEEELRKRGWKWSDLARKSQVNYATLQNWRDQRSSPTNVINIKKIATVLGLSLHYLCYGVEEREYQRTISLRTGKGMKETILLNIGLSVCRAK